MKTALSIEAIEQRVRARQIFSLQDFLIMWQCSAGPKKVADLAATIGAPKPSITRAIDSLAGQPKPLLVRNTDKDDLRSPWITITTAGKKFVDGLLVTF